MKLTMIDLFAGIGGIRIAFEENGVKCVCSSEIDKNACKTYYENFKDVPLGDISQISKKELPYYDILAGGFPCQPFSIGGLRKGFEDTRGTLFFEVARLLDECKPYAFLLENVQGIITHDKGKTLKTIERSLNDIGYSFMWKVMNAKDYGIPQNRARWYCIGFRKDLEILIKDEEKTNENDLVFYFPQKEELKFYLNNIINKNITKDYQISEIAKKNILKFKDNFLIKHNSNYPLIAYEVRPSRCSFRNDGISPCLTAKMGTGGNNVPIIVDQNRKFTERECLDLMGFPKWFNISSNKSHSYKQIGNSVVVPLVSKLVKELVRVLLLKQNSWKNH